MAWIYLVIAGLFEIGWPLGLKMAQTMEGKQFTGLAIAVIAMGLSGFFLFSAQKEIYYQLTPFRYTTNYSFNNGNKNVRRTCTPHIFI